jgi:hypothetical protein
MWKGYKRKKYGRMEVNLSLVLITQYATKTYGVVEVQLHSFLTSALDGGEWSTSRSGHFTPGKKGPCARLMGGWVGPRTSLDMAAMRKSFVSARN